MRIGVSFNLRIPIRTRTRRMSAWERRYPVLVRTTRENYSIQNQRRNAGDVQQGTTGYDNSLNSGGNRENKE